MNAGARCGCNHSLAVVCGVLASLAVALLLAEDRCRELGSRVSDAAWSCEAVSGAVVSLWSLVTPGIAVAAILAGVPVYLATSFLGRRWLFRYGDHPG